MQGPSILSRWFLVTIISALLIFFDHRVHYLEGFRSWVTTAVYPLQAVVDAPNTAYNWVDTKISSRETLMQRNQELESEMQLLQAKLLKLSALQVENDRLRELLKSSKKVGEQVLIGELLAVDLEPFTRQVVINKGSRHGVYLGQPLLDAHGVMGQVVHVGPFSSTGMLITDPSHAIPVQNNRNGLRAIVLGTGSPDVLEVPYLANSAEIREGDLLVSSGLGGRFPPDYPVAKVTSVLKDPTKPYAVVTAEPTAQLERSREVLLVWRTQEGEAKVSAPDADSTEQNAQLEQGERPSGLSPTKPPAEAIRLDTPRLQAPAAGAAETPQQPTGEVAQPTPAATSAAQPTAEKPAAEPAPSQASPTLKVTAPRKPKPEPEKPKAVPESKPKPAPAAAKPATETKPAPQPKPVPQKPKPETKTKALPLSDLPMPIEEDFVAPSGPNDGANP